LAGNLEGVLTPVAVLGAGFQGVCAALALASRGIEVDLYDRNAACITQAGLNNEGKIHLGFTYASDRTGRTAEIMARGALAFGPALVRWLERPIEDIGLSGPHHYAVHRASMLPPGALLAHFELVRRTVRALAAQHGSSYLGVTSDSIAYEEIDVEPTYDSRFIVANIKTSERSVDVAQVASLLRKRVAEEPLIEFHPATEVAAASSDGRHIDISLVRDGHSQQRRYRQVVNCLWDGQSAIDEQMGCLPTARWFYRLKYGAFLTLRDQVDVPSTTFTLGPFGDVVVIDPRRLYLSWYPVARTVAASSIEPRQWPEQLPRSEACAMARRMRDEFASLMPQLRAPAIDDPVEISVRGGIIVAQGETDIDDPASRLHERTGVGVRSQAGYHSVDTGKYTLAPMLALAVAERISHEYP
jgi:2-polyprenyl-6-methoxyphenol hydroxylase-like FAD-dependent oxidoreductase